ncbi:MAG: 16S rRNA (cytosine(1402)-N(4))-methyltransferase RsmH [Bacteroidales bacterium]
MSNVSYHIPVLLKQSVDALVQNPDGVYVDATFGGGGHAAEILQRLSPKGRLFAFDQDVDAKGNVDEADTRLTFILSNFRYIQNHLAYHEVFEVDGILADFGVSSHEFDEHSRGFSFRFDAELDMRMNQSQKLTAKTLVNEYSEEALAHVFGAYGELSNARKIASAICVARRAKDIDTIKELLEVIKGYTSDKTRNKFYARVFQALRMEVNDEVGALNDFLINSVGLLKKDARLVCITYHSLEDRPVKNIMKTGNLDGNVERDFFGVAKIPFSEVSRKVIVPEKEEVSENSRSRSAKLRIAIK